LIIQKEDFMEKVKMGAQTLLYPTPAVLVGAMVDDIPNFMTAAWCGVAASTPPAISVALRRARYTIKGVEASGTFSINVPSAEQAQIVDYCGIYSGHRRDKSQIFQVEFGNIKTAPMIAECPVSLECNVIHTLDLGSHVLFIGQIMESYVRQDCITDGKPDAGKIDPLIYSIGTEQYHLLGRVVGRAFHMGKDSSKEVI
jgi:flavin reductase (DIM6/NTAB) family NADH-FMN oxidoreductase RutF